MKFSTVLSSLAISSLASANPTQTIKELPKRAGSLPAVSASGNAFWADGKRFYIRGVDYQPGGSSAELDPLGDPNVCLRDIEKFKELGINTIRVYMVDNSVNHDECMNALAAAGIYLVLDANTPKYSINRAKPHNSYNAAYLQNIFATMDEFAKYDNTLAFFSGNEVINEQQGTTISAPYVKAVTRDMKNYILKRGLRKIPVGYSAADVSDNRMQTAAYFNCGSDDARSDFFAFNDYSWCNTDFETAEWDKKVANFTDYGLPIFLSEYGCTTNGRDFGEIEALMSDKMTGVYSGGLMYEYTMEDNGFGIVEESGGSIKELPEFSKLAKAMEEFPAPAGDGGAAATTHSVPCPSSGPSWEVEGEAIPAMPVEAQVYMDNGAGQGLGFKGPGSQENAASGTSASNVTDGKASDGADSSVGQVGPFEIAPLLVTGITLGFTLLGAVAL